MKNHIYRGVRFFLASVLAVGLPFAFVIAGAGDPVITSIAGDNFINASEFTSVSVPGTIGIDIAATTTVTVTLTDSAGSPNSVSFGPIDIAPSNTAFTATLDTTGLIDGPITSTITSSGGGTPGLPVAGPNAIKDIVVPTLSTVSIASNSGTTTAGATVGDTITVSFTASEPIGPISATIAGKAAVIATTTETTGTAVVTLNGIAETDGAATFSIAFADKALNSGTTVTTTSDSSVVTIDETGPNISVTVPAASAFVNGTELVTFTGAGSPSPICSIDDVVFVACTTGVTTISSITGFAALPQGAFNLIVQDSDGLGNVTKRTIALTKDTVAPTFTAERTGLNTILLTFNEPVSASDTATAAWSLSQGTVVSVTQPSVATTLTITTSGITDTFATPIVTYASAFGTVLDRAGNEVANASNAVSADKVAPTLTVVTIATTGATPTKARTGDTVTLTLVSSEPIAAPAATITGRIANITVASTTEATASVTMLVTDTEGIIPFNITFTDTAGNAGTAVTALTSGSNITFDRTAPTLTITAPATSAFVKGTAVVLFTDGEQTLPSCTIDNTVFVACTSGVTTLADITGFNALPDGVFTLTVRDTDLAGNTGTASRSLQKDATSPGSTGTPTGTGAFVNSAQKTAGLTIVVPLATSTSGAVAGDTLDLLLGGVAFGTPVTKVLSAGDISTNSVSFSVAGSQLGADGAKAITARITDVAGNVGTVSSALSFTLDTVVPTAIVTYSTSNPVKSGATLTITASSTEPLALAPVTTVAISGSNTVAATAMTRIDSTHYTFAHTVGAGNGPATVVLGAGTDLAGNPLTATPTSGDTFVVDNTVPTLSLVTISSNNANPALAKVGDRITISFTSTEALQLPSGTIKGNTASSSDLGGNSYSLSYVLQSTDADAATPVPFSISFTDLAGNAGVAVVSTTDASIVVYDKTAPAVSEFAALSTPSNNTTPTYKFVSTEAGTITYGGDCSSVTTAGTSGTNTVVFNALGNGAHTNCTVRVTDAAGNQSITSSVTSFTIDLVAPTIVSVDSVSADGSYKAGASIPVTVTFSEPVTSTGNVTLTFNPTGPAATCTFAISATTTGSCNYVVSAGQTAADLDAVVSGTIADLSTNALVSFTPATTLATNKNIVIDTTAPTVTAVATAKADGSYKAGEVIDFTVTMSENVTVSGTPLLALNSGGSASFLSGSGSNTLTFRYTVLATENSADLDYTATNSLTLNSGTILDGAANAATLTLPAVPNLATTHAIVVDTTAPVLAEVTPVTNPTNDSTPDWTFSSTEAGTISYTTCVSPTTAASVGSTTVTFNTLADGTFGGCSITVTDLAGNVSARRAVSSFVVDTVRPTIVSLNSTTANGAFTTGAVIPVTVVFSEPVTSTGNVTLTFNPTGPAATCTFAITASTTGSCSYTVSAGQTSADLDATVTGTINDVALNTLTNFTPATTLATNKNIVIDTTAPTVTAVATAKADGFYKVGEVIDFTVTMSEPVTITGTPKIALNTTGGGFADVISGTGTNALTLRYTVSATENSADLDYNATNSFGSAGTITDAAGNVANRTLPALPNIALTHAIVVDTTAPTATTLPTAVVGPLINAAENTAGIAVVAPLGTSGAVAGDTLTLLLGGAAFPTPLTRILSAGDITAGSFSFTVSFGQLGADGAKSITSRVTDLAGNVGAQSTALSLTLDTVAPVAPSVTSIAGNNKINNSEKAAIIAVGSAEADALVSVTLTDSAGSTKTNTQQLSGGATAYSITLDGTTATPAAFIDGVVLPTVTATDAAGNTSTPASLPGVLQDTVAPAAPVVALTTPVNASNVASTTISGTGEANTTVAFSVTNGTTTVSGAGTVNSSGNFSISGISLTTVNDGTLTASTTLTDGAGNTGIAGTNSANKDVVLPIFSSITPATNAFINNITTSSAVGFTLSETLSSGTIIFTRTGGSADASSPRTCTLAGTAKNAGAHTINLADTTNGCAVAQTLVDGAIYSVAFSGSDVALNPSAVTTRTGITFDITSPAVTITSTLPSVSTATSLSFALTTNENATCSSRVDSVTTVMTGTGGTSHTQATSSVAVGAHTLQFSCVDPATNSTTTTLQSFTVLATSGNTLSAGTTNPSFDSLLSGQADIPSGISSIVISDSTALDFGNALSITGGGTIDIGGVTQPLSSITTGDLVERNLSVPLTDGDQNVQIAKAVKIVMPSPGEEESAPSALVITNSAQPTITVSIPNNTTVFGPSAWDGTLFTARASTTGGNIPSGFTIAGESLFGSTVPLFFSRPVTITLASTTRAIAYKPSGSSNWVTIGTTCGGTFAVPVSPLFASECTINNGTDTKVVAYHFTSFAQLVPIPPAPTSSASGSNGPTNSVGGGGGGGGGIFGFFTFPNVNKTDQSGTGTKTAGTTGVGAGSVLGAKTFRFTRNLLLGSRLSDVTELQKILVAEGYLKVAPTGFFGALTRTAVKAYQTKNKLESAGSVGPKTRALLNSWIEAQEAKARS